VWTGTQCSSGNSQYFPAPQQTGVFVPSILHIRGAEQHLLPTHSSPGKQSSSPAQLRLAETQLSCAPSVFVAQTWPFLQHFVPLQQAASRQQVPAQLVSPYSPSRQQRPLRHSSFGKQQRSSPGPGLLLQKMLPVSWQQIASDSLGCSSGPLMVSKQSGQQELAAPQPRRHTPLTQHGLFTEHFLPHLPQWSGSRLRFWQPGPAVHRAWPLRHLQRLSRHRMPRPLQQRRGSALSAGDQVELAIFQVDTPSMCGTRVGRSWTVPAVDKRRGRCRSRRRSRNKAMLDGHVYSVNQPHPFHVAESASSASPRQTNVAWSRPVAWRPRRGPGVRGHDGTATKNRPRTPGRSFIRWHRRPPAITTRTIRRGH
jgi:hypothetical protein